MRLQRSCCAVLLLIAIAVPGAQAQRIVYGGGWTIPDPIIVNIYWDNNWESDMAGSKMGSRAAIDAWTRALCDSTYFTGLSEYGIRRCEFRGSFTTSDASPSPRANIAEFQLLLHKLLTERPAGFPPAGVDLDRDAHRVIYNIMASPATRDVNGFAAAYHFFINPTRGQPHNVTFAALFPAQGSMSTTCVPPTIAGVSSFGTIAGLTESMTHEVVEEVTDPGVGPGWWNINVAKPLLLAGPTNGEIADLTSTSSNFLFGCTEDFWSQNAGAPTTGYSNRTSPVITGIALHGAGRSTSLVIDGTGFGSAPGELANGSFTGQTVYLNILDTFSGIQAGHLLSDVNATYAAWSDTRILIEGIASDSFSSRHDLAVQVFSTANGMPSSFTAAAAAPAKITMASPQALYSAGPLPISLVGIVGDQYQNAFGPVTVHWSSPETGHSGNVTSSDGGAFTIRYPLDHSGPQSLTVSLPGTSVQTMISFNVAPTITGVTPDHGPVNPASPPVITVSGYGLGPNTAIRFLTQPATATEISPNRDWIRVTQPPSPLPGGHFGWLDVVAETQGLESVRGPSDLFAYYLPGNPLLLPAPDGLQCGRVGIEAVLWDASGAPVTDSAVLAGIRFHTTHGSFSESGPAQTVATPASITNGILSATLYESAPGVWIDTVSVGRTMRRAPFSSENVTINNTLCEAVARQPDIAALAGRLDLRAALRDWVRPRVPRDALAGYTQPFTASMSISSVALKGSMRTVEARLTVLDANRRPVKGVAVQFLTGDGKLGATQPQLTDAKGTARSSLQMTKAGVARVSAVAAELPRAVVGAYTPAAARVPAKKALSPGRR